MRSKLRKWGNSAGVIIPAAALNEAKFKLGDALEVEAREGEIVIREASASYTLEELLEASPDKSISLDDEDSTWLNDDPEGGETL